MPWRTASELHQQRGSASTGAVWTLQERLSICIAPARRPLAGHAPARFGKVASLTLALVMAVVVAGLRLQRQVVPPAELLATTRAHRWQVGAVQQSGSIGKALPTASPRARHCVSALLEVVLGACGLCGEGGARVATGYTATEICADLWQGHHWIQLVALPTGRATITAALCIGGILLVACEVRRGTTSATQATTPIWCTNWWRRRCWGHNWCGSRRITPTRTWSSLQCRLVHAHVAITSWHRADHGLRGSLASTGGASRAGSPADALAESK